MNEINIENVRERIIAWSKENIRPFPWRYSTPYNILVSEFMLHRTQAFQVLPVFLVFINKYSNLNLFAKANNEEVKQILQPLGLNWRINGMINALHLINHYYGEIPIDYEKLRAIEGIGQYIAGAVIVFCQNKPMTLVDTNTVRVIGRLFGLIIAGEARKRKVIFDAINKTVDSNNPRDFYYAIIDIAHSICTIKNPNCKICPLFSLPCNTGKDYL